ncbi:META domain-containing protein [Shewanella sp. VB17]|uniref:META domain-containing protein n=1 Tax=Shewanella sp. VB17 TaxID=2739432 RepID=UPI001564B558|nr:META domain-containing protein [Shewanella sp. VB17]NRD75143.1 META domain-containing protein [Shewanella sp. VB17]
MFIKSFIFSVALIGLAACQSSGGTQIQSTEIQGVWNIETIIDRPVIDYSPAQLIFAEEGKFTGNNSCNNFFGNYSINEGNVRLMIIGNTMKACVDALMEQEQRVMSTIPEVTSASMSQGKLLLKDAKGNTQLMLSKG